MSLQKLLSWCPWPVLECSGLRHDEPAGSLGFTQAGGWTVWDGKRDHFRQPEFWVWIMPVEIQYLNRQRIPQARHGPDSDWTLVKWWRRKRRDEVGVSETG